MNAHATIGHNNPPEPTPFDLSKDSISALFDEAKNWCDGEPISTQGQADMVQKLLRDIQAAEKEADERRVAENKPFDDGKAEVQARYAPLIANTKSVKGMTVLAVEACKKALAPWLIKVDAENRAKAEALVQEAKAAETATRRADNAKASAKGEGRAVTLRDKYTPEVTDYTAFARHVWTTHRSDMEDFLSMQAVKLVAAGVRSGVPGVTIHHERVPV
jgi:hypothetical protein